MKLIIFQNKDDSYGIKDATNDIQFRLSEIQTSDLLQDIKRVNKLSKIKGIRYSKLMNRIPLGDYLQIGSTLLNNRLYLVLLSESEVIVVEQQSKMGFDVYRAHGNWKARKRYSTAYKTVNQLYDKVHSFDHATAIYNNDEDDIKLIRSYHSSSYTTSKELFYCYYQTTMVKVPHIGKGTNSGTAEKAAKMRSAKAAL
ncbi:TPA: hypothetical protein KDX48_002324 [Vibrio parahaemolyticus]|nr:hypothetical protein [Vibrio parahaemolyticus]